LSQGQRGWLSQAAAIYQAVAAVAGAAPENDSIHRTSTGLNPLKTAKVQPSERENGLCW